MKKLLSMFLACVLLLGILPTSAWAADSVEAALGEVDIYNGGYELGYRTQFAFLRENNISTTDEMTAYQSRTEETLADLMKQRTILNVRKKKRQALYDALADVEALAPAKVCYEKGLSGMEEEFARYMQAVRLLERCGVPSEHLTQEKTEVYNQLAELNRQIRAERKKLALCREIQTASKQMEEDIRKTETRGKEVEHDEHRRR